MQENYRNNDKRTLVYAYQKANADKQLQGHINWRFDYWYLTPTCCSHPLYLGLCKFPLNIYKNNIPYNPSKK